MRLLLLALPPVAASAMVLRYGEVGRGTWTAHLVSIALAGILAIAGHRLSLRARRAVPEFVIAAMTLAALALPLLADADGPTRWLSVGGVHLYMAPLVLPMFLASGGALARRDRATVSRCWIPMIAAALALALQPDASQGLALLAGAATIALTHRPTRAPAVAALVLIALIAAWSTTRPDPLLPVPHVEGVFALAFAHSFVAGLAVAASAVVFATGLAWWSRHDGYWLGGVAAYYAVLYAGSVAGRTPAPLIGFGAGPMLGFGLLVGTAAFVSAGGGSASRALRRQGDDASRR
ncbi:MAG: hypothetical protein IT359_10545 [Gemmatimonadaceae bacterium]|nr:hypothetical protein [Gemmatimonadaceae bacterium]